MRISALTALFLFILTGTAFTGCRTTKHGDNPIHGSSQLTSRTKTLEACEGVVIKASGKVYISQSETQSIRIEADDNIIDRVTTTRENGLLVVGLKEGSYSDITLHVYASLKDIRNITIEGAATIESRTPITTNALECIVNGAGTVDIRGKGDRFTCVINGTGLVDADGFLSKKCDAVVNGAGSCSVTATQELSATVNGVGKITYYGHPSNIKTSNSGIGWISEGD